MILKEMMYFYYMIYVNTHENFCPRGHEIYNLGRPFLGHSNCSWSNPCLGLEKKIFKEIMLFHDMIYKAKP